MQSAADCVESVQVSPVVRVGQSRNGSDVAGEDLAHKANGRSGSWDWKTAKESDFENEHLLLILTDPLFFDSASEDT